MLPTDSSDNSCLHFQKKCDPKIDPNIIVVSSFKKKTKQKKFLSNSKKEADYFII